MRKFLAIVAVSIVGFLLSTEANANDNTEPKAWEREVSRSFLSEMSYGAHLVSFHKPGSHMETVTPGAYVLHIPTGATLGAYRNSEGKLSAYAGVTLERGPWQLTVGAVTGYNKRAVLPMLAPSYKFDNGMRVSLIPNPFGHSAIHVSKEF
jgi:hypothetical protein